MAKVKARVVPGQCSEREEEGGGGGRGREERFHKSEYTRKDEGVCAKERVCVSV